MVKVTKQEFQGFMSYISDHLGWFRITCDKSGVFSFTLIELSHNHQLHWSEIMFD